MIIKNRNILLVSIGFFFVFFAFGSAQQFIISIFSTFGGQDAAITSLILLYVTFAFGTFLSPKIISFLGSKKSFVLSAFIYSVFILSIASGIDYILYIFSVLAGLAAAVIWTNVGSYIIRITTEKDRGEGLGFQTSLFVLGNLVGISFTTVLIGFLSTQEIFLVLASFSFVGIIPFLGIKDVKINIKRRLLSDIISVFHSSKVILLVPTVIVVFFLWSQVFSSISLVAKDLFGISYVGVIGIIFSLVFLFSAYFLGVLTRFMKKHIILAIVLVAGLIGLFVFQVQTNLIISMISIVLISVFISAGFPVAFNLMKDISPKDSETVAGSFHLINSSSVTFSLVSVILVKEMISLQIALVIGIIALITLATLSRIKLS